jgi:light-regulated signal transduction histidine kinase (bacteriophytochrome)
MALPFDTGLGAGDAARGRVLTEELADLASRAGHDLVGPLNQAAALLALFVKRHGSDRDGEAATLIEHLGNAALRMDTTLAGIKGYLNMAGKPLERRTVSLHSALSAALAALDPAVKASGAKITAEPLPSIDCDGDKMAAIFEILIDNAIKFRRVAEAPRIYVSAGRRDGAILIAVADNGMGIDPKYCEDVLLPFRRLNGREYPGAGLGLATAKLIARLHGGSLRIDPAPGAGATVTIMLPEQR